MKTESVITYLTKNGYKKTEFYKTRSFFDELGNSKEERYTYLPFEYIYSNEIESELYILIEKESLFTLEEIQEYERKVLTFINFRKHDDPIRYNINLILLCPLNIQEKNQLKRDDVSDLLTVERSKYFCRKILLDTSEEEFNKELSILPSFPIEVNLEGLQEQANKLANNIEDLISSKMFQELNKDINEVNIENVLSLLNNKGEV